MPTCRHRVVIVGAGFGGLAAAKALAGMPVDVTVVDARNHHTFQPLLYQVATAGLDVDDVCHSLRGIFQRQHNVRVRLGAMTGHDVENGTIQLDGGTELPYDSLVLACGAVTATFGIPGVEEHAFGLKNVADALAIRDHILCQFEAADASPDEEEPGRLTFLIGGAGPTGVELAGGLAELVDCVLRRDFPSLDVDRVRIVLVEASDAVLGTFAPQLGLRARRALERVGVEVLTNAAVSAVTEGEVQFVDGTSVPTRTMIWAAGVRAHPLAELVDLPTLPNGRIVVDEHLEVTGQPGVFAIGDLAAAQGPTGELLPQVAPAAIQGGKHVGKVIAARLGAADAPGPFRYRDRGSMATIGRRAAVVELPSGRTMSGSLGWLAWLGLHLVMLIGFRNRANVLVNWAWNYMTYDRGSRIIVERAPAGAPQGSAVTSAERSKSKPAAAAREVR